MMRTDFVPLYFPENNGKKMEYMTVTLVAPDRRTGERPEISQKEGKYLHVYLDFIRSLLWSFCLQKLSGVCVCVCVCVFCVYSYYLNGKVLLFSKI